jgi:hypothetical protein
MKIASIAGQWPRSVTPILFEYSTLLDGNYCPGSCDSDLVLEILNTDSCAPNSDGFEKFGPLSGDDAVVFCGFVPAPSDIIGPDLRGNGATRNPSSREVAAIFSRRAISRATSCRRSSAQSAAGTEPCVRTTQTVGQRVTPLAWVNAATAASYSVEDIPGGGMTGLAVAPIIGDILLEFVVRARRAPPLARGSSRYSHRPRPLRRYKFACCFLL